MAHLDQFLTYGDPTTLTEPDAKQYAEHLRTCDECASKLLQADQHREALLNALNPAEPLSLEELDGIASEQTEFRVFAESVIGMMPPETRRTLSQLGKVSDEQRYELQTLTNVDPATFRVALAVAEVSLALESLALRSETGEVAIFEDGRVAVPHRDRIPESYFPTRIAARSEIPVDAAEKVWLATAAVTVRGDLGMPGFSLAGRLNDRLAGVRLSVVTDI